MSGLYFKNSEMEQVVSSDEWIITAKVSIRKCVSYVGLLPTARRYQSTTALVIHTSRSIGNQDLMLIVGDRADAVSLFISIRSSEMSQRWGEFNLTLRLQWRLWSRHPAMSQERWQTGRRVNLPFNRLSTPCMWPNSQSWQIEKGEAARTSVQWRERSSIIWTAWLCARSHFLLISQHNPSHKAFIRRFLSSSNISCYCCL